MIETIPFDPTIPVFESIIYIPPYFTGWCYINSYPEKIHCINGGCEYYEGYSCYTLESDSVFDGTQKEHVVIEKQYHINDYWVSGSYYFGHPKVISFVLKNILNL